MLWTGARTDLGLRLGHRGYSGVFPLDAQPRADDYIALSFGVQNSQINLGGFTPNLNCSYTRNRSNIAFYDYEATECTARLTREF